MDELLRNVVEVLETRYLPRFQQLETRLLQRYPSFRIFARSHSIGGATELQAHGVFVEACRVNGPDLEPNSIALEIEVRDLPGTPRLCTLDVCWGGDGVPPCEWMDALPNEIPFTADALRVIDEALPRLEKHFDYCLSAWEVAYPFVEQP